MTSPGVYKLNSSPPLLKSTPPLTHEAIKYNDDDLPASSPLSYLTSKVIQMILKSRIPPNALPGNSHYSPQLQSAQNSRPPSSQQGYCWVEHLDLGWQKDGPLLERWVMGFERLSSSMDVDSGNASLIGNNAHTQPTSFDNNSESDLLRLPPSQIPSDSVSVITNDDTQVILLLQSLYSFLKWMPLQTILSKDPSFRNTVRYGLSSWDSQAENTTPMPAGPASSSLGSFRRNIDHQQPKDEEPRVGFYDKAHLMVHKFSPVRIRDSEEEYWTLHISVVYDENLEHILSDMRPPFSPLMQMSIEEQSEDTQLNENGLNHHQLISSSLSMKRSPLTRDGVLEDESLRGERPSTPSAAENSDSQHSSSTPPPSSPHDTRKPSHRSLTGSPFPSPSTSRKMAAFLSKKSERLSVVGLGLFTTPVRTSSNLVTAEPEGPPSSASSSTTPSSVSPNSDLKLFHPLAVSSNRTPDLRSIRTTENQDEMKARSDSRKGKERSDSMRQNAPSVLPRSIPNQKSSTSNSVTPCPLSSRTQPSVLKTQFPQGEPIGLGLTTSPVSFEESKGFIGRSELFGSLVGSYEESILSGRMSTLPSKPIPFIADLGVVAFGPCSSKLKCPSHRVIDFPAYFYEYENDLGLATPYVGTIDLRPSSVSGIKGGHAMGYRIPPKGQLQLLIKNPSKTPIKVFLIPYDFSDMPRGHKTFLRQKSYVVSSVSTVAKGVAMKGNDTPKNHGGPPLLTSNFEAVETLSEFISSGASHGMRPPLLTRTSTLERLSLQQLSPLHPSPDRLRYAVHLQVISSPHSGRLFITNSIRVVFSHRSPETDEKLRVVLEGPSEPKYTRIEEDAEFRKQRRAKPYQGKVSQRFDKEELNVVGEGLKKGGSIKKEQRDDMETEEDGTSLQVEMEIDELSESVPNFVPGRRRVSQGKRGYITSEAIAAGALPPLPPSTSSLSRGEL